MFRYRIVPSDPVLNVALPSNTGSYAGRVAAKVFPSHGDRLMVAGLFPTVTVRLPFTSATVAVP
jgi:hypothetical protein